MRIGKFLAELEAPTCETFLYYKTWEKINDYYQTFLFLITITN